MATGITIDEVTNTLDDIQGTEKIPVSSGISEPEVVTTGDLKEYINDGMQEEISDLNTIRSGASAGATAYQKPSSGIPSTDLASAVQTSLGKADTALQSFTETDPTVPSWAKSSSKPSYNYSEINGTPTLANVATSGDYDDLTNKPTIPAAQIQSDWNQSNSSAKDYIKNKPTIPDLSNCIQKSSTSGLVKNDGTIDTNSYITSAHEVPGGGNAGQVLKKTTGTDYDYAWSSITETYPSAYCSTAGGTALKVANCTLWAATANTYLHILMGVPNTYQGELKLKVNSNPSASGATIYINGVVSSSTNYTLPAGSYIIFYDGTYFHFRTDGRIPYVVHTSSTSGLMKNDGSVDTNTYLTSHQDISGKADKVTSATNGNFAALDSNGNLTDSGHKHSDYLTSHQDLSNYVQKSNTTGLLKNDGSVDTNTYLTSAPVTSVNGQTGAVSLSIPTESTVSGWGFTKNAGTITGVTMNGASKGTSGVVDLGTVITAHQDISGKENTSNKVTSLSSSSTDTEYPSAKCVYDLVGDIETILASI